MTVVWDTKKADKNLKKHGVSFEEAATTLLDPLAITFTDDEKGEERNITIGHSALQKLLLVITTERENDIIRIISARKTTKHERKVYEEGI